jgi:alkylhydroperoxidase/carboxymuconolactone decarboxylase family protein YurZ
MFYFIIKNRNFMKELPKAYKDFKEKFPDFVSAYENIGVEVYTAGRLDEKTRSLIKLAISVGAKMEGAVHAQVRKAKEIGLTHDEIYQACVLALPTIGFPSTVAGFTWINNIHKSKN